MKQLLFFFVFISVLSSCSIERRHYLPGLHVEWRNWKGEILDMQSKNGVRRKGNGEWRMENEEWVKLNSSNYSARSNNVSENDPESISSIEGNSVFTAEGREDAPIPEAAVVSPAQTEKGQALRFPVHSSFSIPHSPASPDTLKKPYKPQQQYREVDPVGKASVVVVVAAVALQKVAALLTWFEVVMPLSFGPGIFIPALVIAIIGLGLSAYSALRVRKNPEKYKKNEWGKASLAILGWQILMSALFAWLLGGLPVG